MSPRQRAGLQICVLLAVIVALLLIFPRALSFAEKATRELRYLWWIVLLLALALWLIWGAKRKRK